MADEVLIGLDLGGTRIRAARFDLKLNIQQRVETFTMAADGPEAVIGRLIEQIRRVWPADGALVAGIGVSSPGPLNPFTGVVIAPPNLPGWHHVPLSTRLQNTFGVPAYLGNDANLAALAETELGAARGCKDVIYLTISTGIGGGVIVDGKLLTGSAGLGAECGQLMLVVEDGRATTLEQEAAGLAIARQAREALARGESSDISERVRGNLDAITARIVGEAAKVGDPLAQRLITRSGFMIGLGIVSLLHTFNPQIVVIGGGIAEGMGELLFEPMRTAIKQ
ncbi:MAG: ROK family protein [Aggregatilineales bacterium]